MNTRTLKYHAPAGSAPKAGPTKAPVRVLRLPSMKTVANRLATLSLASMPWLRKDVDLTPPDGGPEACGPADYQPPRRHS
jgi:hypothetical protein